MAKAYPSEFREDIVAVARRRGRGVTLRQIAEEFGVSATCVQRWVQQADIDDGARQGTSSGEPAENRDLRRRVRLLEQEKEVLRRAAAYLSQANLDLGGSPKGIYPLVVELAANGIPVAVTCRVLKIARQPYYRWRDAPVSETEWVQAHRVNALVNADRDDPQFGYRFLADEAARASLRMCRRTAWALCSQQGLVSRTQGRRGKNHRPGPPVFDDLVRRVFRADTPNQVWLTDITEHPTGEGKVYGCAVKDVYSGRIAGYSISDRMTSKLAVDALNSAVVRRGDVAGCILHADRGSQFRSHKMTHALNRHRMVGSMGRVGAAGDNAAMESFWSLLQTNVLNHQRWTARQQVRLAIVTWIERTYHRRRGQARLGVLTPIEYEATMKSTQTVAA